MPDLSYGDNAAMSPDRAIAIWKAIILIVLLLGTSSSFAEVRTSPNYTSHQDAITSGGTTSDSANYEAHSAFAEVLAGDRSTSSNYQVVAGFLRLVRPVADAEPGTANLSVEKSNSLFHIESQQSFDYTIVVSNAGPEPVIGATLSDTISEDNGIFCTDWSCSAPAGASCATSDGFAGSVDLPAGAGATFTLGCFSGSINASSVLTNTAQLLPPNGITDPDLSDNQDDDIDSVGPVDIGDAPAPYPSAPEDDGARHLFIGGLFPLGPRLGSVWGGDDGIVFTTALVPGVNAAVEASVNEAALLDAWIDFNGDGDWDDGGERIFAGVNVSAGANNLNFTIPAGAVAEITYARFRLSSTGVDLPTGFAIDGEVEDYQLVIGTNTIVADLSITKENSLAHIFPGQDFDYTVTAYNDGPSAVTGADVSDTIPDELQCDAWTCSASVGASCTASGSGDINDTVDLASGASVTYTLGCQFGDNSPPQIVTNTASITPPDGTIDPDLDNNNTDDIDSAGLVDTGDAPSPPYQTLLVGGVDGARHLQVGAGGPRLGSAWDADSAAHSDPDALGDDNDGIDDEDGVVFTSDVVAGENATVDVIASEAAVLDAWLDFNGIASWGPAEKIFDGVAVSVGVNSLTFAVPGSAKAGTSFARFRISSSGIELPTGVASDGEVEDHEVFIFDDVLPIADMITSVDNGVNHIPAGSPVQYEVIVRNAGPQDGWVRVASNDDMNCTWTCTPSPGASCTPSGSGPILDATHQQEPFIPAGGQLIYLADCQAPADASFVFGYNVSAAQHFTIDPEPSNNTGVDQDTVGAMDAGDAPPPYPTLMIDQGARHIAGMEVDIGQPRLGELWDADADGQPDPDALGDDTDGTDDDDGVVFTSDILAGSLVTVEVTVSQEAALWAWLDFNRDGDWDDEGEKIFEQLALTQGLNNLSFEVPLDAIAGTSYARFRVEALPAGPGVRPLGPAFWSANGEIEDYEVEISVPVTPTELSIGMGTILNDDFEQHSDNDGISDQVEDAAPNNGNGNGDGVPDSQQTTVSSVPSATTGDYITLEASVFGASEACPVEAVTVTDPTDLPPDDDFPKPQGMLEFTLGCAVAEVSIYFHGENEPIDLEILSYRKFGPTHIEPTDHWYTLPTASFFSTVIDGSPVLVARLFLVDGLIGDHDLAVNGQIVDPGALAKGPPDETLAILNYCIFAAGGEIELGMGASVDCSVRAANETVKLENDSLVIGNIVNRDGEISIDQRVEVDGSVFAGNQIGLNQDSAVGGMLSSGADIHLGQRTVVAGDAVAAGEVKLKDGAVVGGSIIEGAIVVLPTPLTLPDFSISTDGPNVTIAKNVSENLPPGEYGKLRVKQGATLELSTGNYVFEQIHVEKSAALNFDVTDGPILIDVAKHVEMKAEVTMASSGPASEVLFRIAGEYVQLHKSGSYLGTFVAPWAQITLHMDAVLTGALYAEQVQLKQNSRLIPEPAVGLFIDLFGQP